MSHAFLHAEMSVVMQSKKEVMVVNYSRLGLYAGAVIGLIIFVVVWLLPAAVLGGISGSKIQGFFSSNSQGIIAAIIMGFVVIASGVIFTSFLSLIGWLAGNAYGALISKQAQITLQWCPVGKLTGNGYGKMISKTIKGAQEQVTLQWCPKV